MSNEVHILGINSLKLEALVNLSVDSETSQQNNGCENSASDVLSVLAR